MITSGTYWIVVLVGVLVIWRLPPRVRPGFLAATSVAYLATLDWKGCLGFVAWALAFYRVAPRTRGEGKRRLLPMLVVAALGILAFFKYAPPLVEQVMGPSRWTAIAVPLGLSYFTFKLIHYVVEVSRRGIKDRSLPRYLCWAFLFPTFTAGPIERFDHFLKETVERMSLPLALEGLARIGVGLVKKFVVVELVLVKLVAEAGGAPADLATTAGAWRHCLTTFLSVYLDFSAYSDLAIGTSLLFGYRIMENFDWPILARNIGEFWKRWHMTLVGWCRSYVYLPTIGKTRNPYLAVYALCVAVGLWHAGTLSYLLWGLYHATGVVVFQTWNRVKTRRRWKIPQKGAWALLGIVPTVVFVSASFAFIGRGPLAGLQLLARLFALA